MSTRDGKVLKPVFPEESRLSAPELQQTLQEVFAGRAEEGRDDVASCFCKGKKLQRHLMAGYRAWAYLESQQPAQVRSSPLHSPPALGVLNAPTTPAHWPRRAASGDSGWLAATSAPMEGMVGSIA
jgi:hypothetical protein